MLICIFMVLTILFVEVQKEISKFILQTRIFYLNMQSIEASDGVDFYQNMKLCPEGIKLLSCSTQLSMKF